MKNSTVFTFLIVFFFVMPWCLATEAPNLGAEIYKEFNQGAYFQAIELLSKLEQQQTSRATAWYWKAVCYQKLQEHKEANHFFDKAIGSGVFPKEIYYQYGQSLFADNNFPEAIKYFNKSWQLGLKPGHSLFYIAYAHQLAKEYKDAIKYYKQINKLQNIDSNLKQAANFQLGEVYLAYTEDNQKSEKKNVLKSVIPQMQMAFECDSDSPLASEIKKRILEIQVKYGLPSSWGTKPYLVFLDQSFEYDSNVTLTPDNSTNTTAVKKASPISETELFGKYSFNIGNKFQTSPELRLDFDKYFANEPAIYRNDELFIAPSIRNSYQHSFFGRDSALLLDFEYSYAERDYMMTKSLNYYGRSYTFILGESVQWFSQGISILKGKSQQYTSYSPANDSSTLSLNFTQFVKLNKKRLLLFIADYSSYDANNNVNDSATWLLRADYFIPEMWNKTTLQLGTLLSYLDTKMQKSTRGMEKKVNPLVKLTRTLSSKMDMGLQYEYTKNISKDKNSYDYNKHVVTLNFKLQF